MSRPSPVAPLPAPARRLGPPGRAFSSARLARAALLLALLVLAGCSQQRPSPQVLPGPATRPRVTPVPTVAGRPAPTPIGPVTGLTPGRALVFVSDRGGQIDLWLQDIDDPMGQRVRQLTNDAAIESFPTWSPDGTTIAYVVEDERAQRNLWLLDLETGRHRQLTDEASPFEVRRAAWLRGGRALIYDTGRPFDRRPQLRVVTTEGEMLAPLTPEDGSVIYDWSTDGARVVCAVGPPLGEPRLAVADAVPGTPLVPEPSAPVGFGVALSPRGRHAIYLAPPLSENQAAWVLDLATGAARSLYGRDDLRPADRQVEGHRYDHDFAWAPDGERLAYVHGVGGVTDGIGRLRTGAAPPVDEYSGIYLVDREGRERQWLTTGDADAAPKWSPDGRWLAYLTDAREPDASDIWLVAVDPTAMPRQRNLTAGKGNNWSPAWMPLHDGGNHERGRRGGGAGDRGHGNGGRTRRVRADRATGQGAGVGGGGGRGYHTRRGRCR